MIPRCKLRLSLKGRSSSVYVQSWTACIVSRFTSSTSTAKVKQPPRIPPGTVLQRVCDDCASALQQRCQHYNTVQVFELCQWDIDYLDKCAANGIVHSSCASLHFAKSSITSHHILSQVRSGCSYFEIGDFLLVIQNGIAIFHESFCNYLRLLQLIKAVDFSKDVAPEDDAIVQDILNLTAAPRTHNCMMPMCSRLCRQEMECVDALEILTNEAIQNIRLRNHCVQALVKKASADEWLSFLPVVLQELSIEQSSSSLKDAVVQQALMDVRFCSDLYWGLSVLADDRRCRRKFDGFRQQLLLTLAQSNTSEMNQDLFHTSCFVKNWNAWWIPVFDETE